MKLYPSYLNTVECCLVLNFIYRVRGKDYVFIRTGPKGFNLYNEVTKKNLFKRPIYQKNSAKKNISEEQIVFRMMLPEWVNVKEIKCVGKRNMNIVIPKEKIYIKPMINALYRMQLEE